MLNVGDPKLKNLQSTLRPRFENHQSTIQTLSLDPAWDRRVDIYPGMVMMKTVGEKCTLVNAVGQPFGLADHFCAPVLGYDPIKRQGVPAFPVAVPGGPDAKYEVLDPAFDSSLSWVEPTDGTIQLITYYTDGAKRGKLCPLGTAAAGGNTVSTIPVLRLIAVVSAKKILVGGLQARTA